MPSGRRLAGSTARAGCESVHVALSSLVIVFSMWWLYFSKEEHLQSQDLGRSLTWGYGHVLIFAAGAAVGAGFAVVVDIVSGHAQVLLKVGNYAVAVPVALYLLGLTVLLATVLSVAVVEERRLGGSGRPSAAPIA